MPTWKCLLMLKIAPNISFWTQFKIMLEEEIGSGSWASKQIKLRKTRKMIAVDRRSLCCSVWRVYHCTPGQETRARQEPDTGSSQGMGPLQTCQRCWTRFYCEASKLACLNAHLWLCESADNRYFLQGQCTFRGLLHWAFHSECCQTWPTCLGPLVQTMAPDSCCTSADSRQHHCQPTQITAPLQTNLSGHWTLAICKNSKSYLTSNDEQKLQFSPKLWTVRINCFKCNYGSGLLYYVQQNLSLLTFERFIENIISLRVNRQLWAPCNLA